MIIQSNNKIDLLMPAYQMTQYLRQYGNMPYLHTRRHFYITNLKILKVKTVFSLFFLKKRGVFEMGLKH